MKIKIKDNILSESHAASNNKEEFNCNWFTKLIVIDLWN